MCCSPTHPGFRHCGSCEIVRRQLGGALFHVRPVRLAPRGGDLHRHLVAYKAAPSPAVRSEAASRLADLLASYLVCVVARTSTGSRTVRRPVIAVATVPSSGAGRSSWHGTHPLSNVVRMACSRLERGSAALSGTVHHAADLLERGPGPLGHRRAALDGYLVARPARVGDGPLLVVDDLYTSGARAQSAAYACSAAGLTVLAIAPLGRLVDQGGGAAPVASRATSLATKAR